MPATPTRLVLDARAEYIADGDTVLVVVFLNDPDQELGFPNYAKEGRISLLYNNSEIRYIEFDKRFGNGANAEGDFIFQFSRPPVTTNMAIKVTIETFPISSAPSANVLQARIPVTRADVPYIPLESQLDAGINGELRSGLRVEEEV